MHPVFSDNRRLFGYLGAWMVLGSLAAVLLVAGDACSWASALLFALPVFLLYGFVALSAYYVCRSLPLKQRRLPRLVMTFGATSLISGALFTEFCMTWVRIISIIDAPWAQFEFTRRLQAAIFGIGVVLYLLSIFGHDVMIAFENLRNAERRESELHMLAREAELQMLRTQVNPHFLFNSLNSISALTSIDAAAAREMTIALAQFFRQTLAMANVEKIPLSSELALCDSFLTVEKIRFGKKLDTKISADADVQRSLIPPLVLQPLLENAIKHGIRNIAEGGVIEVKITQHDAWLHIVVDNPVEPDAPQASGNGMGLQNIRRRCVNLYNERARVTWKQSDPNEQNGSHRFTVELTIPFETGA
jgi:two-component sensor histidine kinase